ncbi:MULTISPECIES: helix-turn-helix domain-containing protein [Muribaculaceae]|uniref:helix-turn-helix domain-containing protein n=1 Tax=Muribaculaceae TaxID=2005473 RepID=UPI0026269BD1|nr:MULTISPECIES: helix-turn-helix transcriptional regulator [Muribaculaceae]
MERYTLEKSAERPLWWVLTDTEGGLVCCFEEGRFNDTQEFTFVEGVRIDPLQVARLVNEMAQWVRDTHYEILMTSPTAIKDKARQSVGEQLRKARESKGWTVRYVERLTGIANNHISRIEQGKYNVTLDTVAVLADALGVKVTI